ncbi:selenobiotic family peptide radical SAM maturase [candidate division KSB1 bacterium]|nr:selenobiotic family peptide radical SAM maturase [candidate division KSB1 bacterium]
MPNLNTNYLEEVYPSCFHLLGENAWNRLIVLLDTPSIQSFPDILEEKNKNYPFPNYLPTLARLELTREEISQSILDLDEDRESTELNPALELIHSDWKLVETVNPPYKIPEKREEYILVWKHPESMKIRTAAATDQDLLALKLVSEEVNLESAAREQNVPVGNLIRAIHQAENKGILIPLSSKIRRDNPILKSTEKIKDSHLASRYFTLQWHITHACDLNCRHCYDRSNRSPLTLDQGLKILDDLSGFSKDNRVRGHVCFTGGNPFLYPKFFELYQAAADRGFSTSILGNPVSREKIEKLLAIQMPTYYQTSLEGLPEHNDFMRGKGHFTSVVEFLGLLRDLKVSSAIMLTLTKDNIDQILPLVERLRGHANSFTFNRLSPVGEGADLLLPEPDAYQVFLREYVEAAKTNRVIGFKDNLINLIREEKDEPFFGGCTGFGCGAAFSFFAVLPDGETHACRKFPSPIGNLLTQSLNEIYHSKESKRYRRGSAACDDCDLRAVCGGCLAITDGLGKDFEKERDPFCWH